MKMQDEPKPPEILDAVARLMRETVMPAVDPRTAFLVRVAANAIDLVKRQIALQPEADRSEHERLVLLLGREGSLAELNRALCEAIEEGKISLETPGLAPHLWATTMEKLAVDQPSYAAYQRALTRHKH